MSMLLEALFWFVVLAGIFSLITDVINYFFSHITSNKNTEYIVLPVKDCQESIEMHIRSAIWRKQHKKSKNTSQIIVVDKGSSDDTKKIAEQIALDYDFVFVTDKDGYIDFLRNIK